MIQKIKAAWAAGRAGQPMPTTVDRSAGQTGAIIGIAGISVLVVFSVAYGIGHAERKAREAEEADKKKEKKELETLKREAEEAKAELADGGDLATMDDEEEEAEEEYEEEEIEEPEMCLEEEPDLDEDEDQDEEPRLVIVDSETGEVRDALEKPEPDGAEDLWPDHMDGKPEEPDL